MIRFECPNCGYELVAANSAYGGRVACPGCDVNCSVPPPEVEPADEDPADEPRPRFRMRPPRTPCPECGCVLPPVLYSRSTSQGTAFSLLGVFFGPLKWFGLFSKESYPGCARCGASLE